MAWNCTGVPSGTVGTNGVTWMVVSTAGVVWLAYTQGVQRGRQVAPRIVAAEPAQKATGEQKNPYSGLQIYQTPKPVTESTNPAPPAPAAPPRKATSMWTAPE